MKKLLLLHGALGSENQFAALKQALQTNYEIHTLDFYGHGLKSSSAEPYRIEAFAAQVLSWLEENNLHEIDIFGYSMGGYVALKLALKHPEKVSRIFTLATKFNWNEETAAKEVKMLDAEKIAVKVPAFAEDLANRHGAEKWKNVMQKTAEMMLDLGKNNGALTNLQQLEIPIQLAIGDRDTMVSLEETIAVYRQLKNASLLVLPNTPHPLEKVNTTRLAFEIREFFN